MDFSLSQIKCLNNNSNTFCKKNHNLKNTNHGFFLVNADDFFELCRHHRAFVQVRCDVVCPRDTECSLHSKLGRLEFYAKCNQQQNLNEDKIVKKLAIAFDKDVAQNKEAFWWTDIFEVEVADVPPNATLRWRAQFL